MELSKNDKLGITLVFDTLELNHTALTYKQHGVRDLPQVDCLPDNILLRIRIFIPGNGKVKIHFEYHTPNIK